MCSTSSLVAVRLFPASLTLQWWLACFKKTTVYMYHDTGALVSHANVCDHRTTVVRTRLLLWDSYRSDSVVCVCLVQSLVTGWRLWALRPLCLTTKGRRVLTPRGQSFSDQVAVKTDCSQLPLSWWQTNRLPSNATPLSTPMSTC